jgi:hypothetical protein
MPVIIAAILGGLVQAMGSLVGRALVALGIGAVTYAGVSTLFNAIRSSAFSWMDSAAAGGALGPWLAVFHVGACMNILFSAVLVRLTLRGLSSGSFKKWVTK